MARFRYSQFCPVARAVELLGERWTLLIGRELLIGPQRFSDLLRRLPGLSSSVLADRLASLEERGLVARRELLPPTPAALYELTESGRGLKPLLYELARFGLRFMDAPRPGDHNEPDWLRLGLDVFRRRGPTPPRVFTLCMPDGERELRIQVAGGPDGTVLRDSGGDADATVFAPPVAVLGLVSGGLDPEAAVKTGAIRVEGDVAALRDLPALFDFSSDAARSEPTEAGFPQRH
ncbi:MAG TPA: winged helix-turn-helix transcriptional regulator [Myxococcota bacterium]